MSPFTIIILAAQRTGVVNPLAEKAGVSHKCLVPICGKALIAHVLDTVTAMDDVAEIRISIEAEHHAELDALLAPWRAAFGRPIALVASAPGIADSAFAALKDAPSPYVITTADNVLVTARSLRDLVDAMKSADAVAGVATEASIKAAHPQAQRNFYQFKDGGYSNCNAYGLASDKAFGALAIFREGGQFMKNPKRLITAFGFFNILLMRYRLVTLAGAMQRASKRFGITLRPVVYADGRLAVDVDNERTYAIAERFLAERLGLPQPDREIPTNA